MNYDRELLVHKLQRWEAFVDGYRLPEWEALPDFGLYMDQVMVLLGEYLSFIPAAGEDPERLVTASTINNYVRLKIMPAPVKRKYGRVHLAYLIMILTLKLSLSIGDVQKLLPSHLTEEEVCTLYRSYTEKFQNTGRLFSKQMETARQEAADPQLSPDEAAGRMVIQWALNASFQALLARKMLSLQGADPQTVLAAEEQEN